MVLLEWVLPDDYRDHPARETPTVATGEMVGPAQVDAETSAGDSFTRPPSEVISTSNAPDQELEAERNELLASQAVDGIPVEDIPARLEQLMANPGPNSLELQNRLVGRWAETNPSAAADWAMTLAAGPARGAALEQVAIAWAN